MTMQPSTENVTRQQLCTEDWSEDQPEDDCAYNLNITTDLLTILVNGEDLPKTEEFTYLGSIDRSRQRHQVSVSSRPGMHSECSPIYGGLSIKTKLRLYRSCVVSTLLYDSECQRMTVSDLTKLSVFDKIIWEELKEYSGQTPSQAKRILLSVIKRAWKSLSCMSDVDGSGTCSEENPTTRVALHWTRAENRRRERPNYTLQKTLEGDMKIINTTGVSYGKQPIQH